MALTRNSSNSARSPRMGKRSRGRNSLRRTTKQARILKNSAFVYHLFKDFTAVTTKYTRIWIYNGRDGFLSVTWKFDSPCPIFLKNRFWGILVSPNAESSTRKSAPFSRQSGNRRGGIGHRRSRTHRSRLGCVCRRSRSRRGDRVDRRGLKNDDRRGS